MRLFLFILCSIFVLPVMAEETVTYNSGKRNEEVPISIVDPGPVEITPVTLKIKEAGRGWTPEEVRDLNASFDLWMRCHLDPNSTPDCTPCRIGNPFTYEMESLLAERCLPAKRDEVIAFNPHLTPEQQWRRDQQICECFKGGKGNFLENMSFQEGRNNLTQNLQMREAQRKKEQDEKDANTVARLVNERALTALNAANYLDDAQNASQLAARYNVKPERREGIGNMWSQRMSELASKADSMRIGDEVFNATNQPPGMCVPYRKYLAAKQFPEDSVFYEDLNALEEFNPGEWDYNEIMERLRSQSGGRAVTEVIQTNAYAHRLYSRAQFLYDNPAIKNIFLSSGNRELKTQLFQNIRQIPRPDCGQDPCTRGDDWVGKANSYRKEMAKFLNFDTVIAAAHDGAISARKTNFNASQTRSDGGNVSGRDDGTANLDASQWGSLCLQNDERRNRAQISRKSFNEFIDDVQKTYGDRDFNRLERDTDFVALNHEVCDSQRRKGKGLPKTFNQYLAERCGNSHEGNCHPLKRTLLISDFNELYPDEVEMSGKTALRESVNPFMNGKIDIPVFGSNEVTGFQTASSDPVLSRSSVRFTSTPQIASMEIPHSSIDQPRAANTAMRPVPEASALNNFSPNLPIQNIVPVDPMAMVPQVPVKPQSVETMRNTIRENDSESRGIKEEIANLRQTLQREREQNKKAAPSEFDGINARIASLERSLEQKKNENKALESKIARMSDDSKSTPSAEVIEPQRKRSTFASVPQAAATPPQAQVQGPVSSGAISAPMISGGAALSNRSVSSPSASSARTSAQSPVSLERFGVKTSSQQGAITVASPSSSINYEELRSESSQNVLPLSVSAEEFNQMANNDQSVFTKYIDQFKSAPGEVVRVNVKVNGEERSLELFVVKNGDQISLVPGQNPGRAIASEGAPLPDKSVERAATLEALRGELRN